jgi:hypothetical protein
MTDIHSKPFFIRFSVPYHYSRNQDWLETVRGEFATREEALAKLAEPMSGARYGVVYEWDLNGIPDPSYTDGVRYQYNRIAARVNSKYTGPLPRSIKRTKA